MRRCIAVAVAALTMLTAVVGMTAAALAEDDVDLLLVLAADISRSVDTAKFKLQREGYAAALTSPKVVAAIQSAATRRIAVCFVEWSGPAAQTVVVDWTAIGGMEDARAFAARIVEAPRAFMERTSISGAIDFSVRQFDRSPVAGMRHVIDISGDGTNNVGRDLAQSRQDALRKGITINGLAILSQIPLPSNPEHTHPPGGLLKYYEENVIGGPGAFALAAEGHEAFGQSILSKLIREIAQASGPVPNRSRE